MTHHGSSQTAWLSLAGGRKIKKRSMEYYTKKEIQNLLDRIDNLLGEKNPKKEDMKDLLESISYILKPMVEEKNEESLF